MASKKWVPHVRCEGARFHVLWWDNRGVHCKEPNCEINAPNPELRDHVKGPVKCGEGAALHECQNDATLVRIWFGGATPTCDRHQRQRERMAKKLNFPPGVYIPVLEPLGTTPQTIITMRQALLEIAQWPRGANEVWARHLASQALSALGK